MPTGHYLKEDRAFLEFNQVERGRHIVDNPCHQPGNMQWSIEEFEKQMNHMRELQRSTLNTQLDKATVDVENALAEIEERLGFD